MSKFKVGDRVKVVSMYVESDEEFLGKVYTVNKVDQTGVYLDGLKEGNDYMTNSQIELYVEPIQKSKPEIIFMDGGRLKIVFAPPYTILEWKYRVNTYKARSTCNPEDAYDKFEGFRLALERLKAKMNKGGWTVKF